ncbi:HPr family phosphocarrier protein [Marinobacter sp. X15-166B]|uniref:HPr family phosphocarrier protein n=1 Tax=Marinobacter sp. X15-166B TaxID=1897620 RepID=UPI00085C606F|nr:HPr family phosphocarrier protein [Marinobacter sp. X15-166B]OEY65207.1 phosphocarrier protein HPr [Marinobacter sp. X15-166B]
MICQSVVIVNKLGLHARAAAKLVSTAANYQSSIHIARDDRTVDAKSIMPVMMLAASQGTTIDLLVDGPDEEAAMNALVELIADCFGEGE